MGVLVPEVPGIASPRTQQKVRFHALKAMGVREVPRPIKMDPRLPLEGGMGARVGRGAVTSEVYEEATEMDTGPVNRTLAFIVAWKQDFKVQCERDRQTEKPSLTFEPSPEGKTPCTEGEWPRRVLWACSEWEQVHGWNQGRLCGKQAINLPRYREIVQIRAGKGKRALIVRVLGGHGRVPDSGRHTTGSGSRKTMHMKMEAVLGAGA